MPTKAFTSSLNSILNRTLDLTAGTFNAHLVTAEPVIGDSTVNNLTLAAGGSLNATASVALSGLTNTGGVLDFNDPVWAGLYTTAATPIVGMVVSRQAGGSPATSDPLVSYIEAEVTSAIANSTTTLNSATVTTTGSFPIGVVGRIITGTGIPVGTIVLERVSATDVRISKAATASGTVTVTVSIADPYTPATTIGGAVSYTAQLPSNGVLRFLAA